LFNRERYKKAMNSPQRLEKLSAKFKRGGNPFAKKVINTSTGEVFGCVGDAADACGYTYNQLKQWLNGRRKNRSTLKYL
jgi:ribosome modulation factor